MKNVFFIIGAIINVSLANSAFALSSVKELTLNCQAQAQVESVRNAAFHPGKPPHFRFPGIEPSSSFTASVKVKTLSPDCEKLKSKYDLNVDGFTLTMNFGTSEALGQSAIEAFAQASVGTIIPIVLKQDFLYQTKDGWLPLFPKVHGETLYFSGSYTLGNTEASGSIQLSPHLNWVYGIEPVGSMTDIEKLGLAEKTAGQVVHSGFSGQFDDLLLKLEPQATQLKKAYAQLIWGVFHQIKISSRYSQQILHFHVGGDGFYYGQPLAAKIIDISHVPGAFSEAEITALIEDIPTILLAYAYSAQSGQNACLNFSAASLEAALEGITLNFPMMSLVEKYYFKDPLVQVTGQTVSMLAGECTKDKVTAKAKALAEDLLQAL